MWELRLTEWHWGKPTFSGLHRTAMLPIFPAWRSLRHLPRKGLRPRHPSSTTFLRLPTLKRKRFVQGARMSQRPLASTTNGRLNLEQQRKRAKELLSHLKKLDPSATLAQAQWQVARQLGFASWPKLKAHIDALDFAARHPGFEASDEARTHHWRCGNDIAHSLQVAGFKGRFQMLSDPLCMGPVRNLPSAEFRRLRSAFISQTFALTPADVNLRVDGEYTQLEALDGAEHSVLWCEADAYDQLFLIRALSSLERTPKKLELIEVDRIPGVERFIGIGQLAPDVLAWLWPQRRLIDDTAVHLAKQARSAYCDSSPTKLAELARTAHP